MKITVGVYYKPVKGATAFVNDVPVVVSLRGLKSQALLIQRIIELLEEQFDVVR